MKNLTNAEWLRLDFIRGEVLVILVFGLTTLLFLLNIPFLREIYYNKCFLVFGLTTLLFLLNIPFLIELC